MILLRPVLIAAALTVALGAVATTAADRVPPADKGPSADKAPATEKPQGAEKAPTPQKAPAAEKPSAPAKDAARTKLPVATWSARMMVALPAAFCKNESYFRQCFDISLAECQYMAKFTTNLCLARLDPNLPEVFEMPEDGATWGTEVGTCAGTFFETNYLKKKKQTPNCDNPDAWK